LGWQQTPPAHTPSQQSQALVQNAPSGRQQRPGSLPSRQAAVSEQIAPSESQQTSVAGSQTACTDRQGSTHRPFSHRPFPPHVVPFEASGLEQRPVSGSQTPATWQASEAVQTTACPSTHDPLRQVPTPAQKSPFARQSSLSFRGFGAHLPLGWQTPRLHGSSSSPQVTPAPGVQTPFWQLSPSVQLSLSALQPVPSGLGRGAVHFPVSGLHSPAS
jgi:hypothetical protein